MPDVLSSVSTPSVVTPGLVPGVQTESHHALDSARLDPGNKCRDDGSVFGGSAR